MELKGGLVILREKRLADAPDDFKWPEGLHSEKVQDPIEAKIVAELLFKN